MHFRNRIADLAARYRVSDGKGFRLKRHDPADTADFNRDDNDRCARLLSESIAAIAALQDKLYAQDRWALLLIIQAMDAAGKDSTIKHVMSGVNPQGCQVYSFKQPSLEELDHDFLWRCSCRVPERGRIGIFNRSYYEEVLVLRVHRELLDREHLPPRLVTKAIWGERFQDINAFERYLSRNGIVVRKVFLHVSRAEQEKRFLARLDEPEKNWKFSAADVREREFWGDYQDAYEDMIRNTATGHAPWFVVPADHKWFSRLVVSAVVTEALQSLDLAYPKVDRAKREELQAARALLTGNKKHKKSGRASSTAQKA